MVISSPLTTRTTRTETERRILVHLRGDAEPDLHSFETVWLAYRLPYTAPEEEEDRQFVFRDHENSGRLNFIGCIWNAGMPVEKDRQSTAKAV